MKQHIEPVITEAPVFLTPEEFLKANTGRFSRGWLYERLRENAIPHIRAGRKILIPADAFSRVMTKKLGGNDA